MLGQTARNSALLSMAALASRLLGWVRLVVLVAAFGADGRLDPYLAAFKVPDIVYQLIAAGPLSSVLVPLVVRLRNENDEPRARRIMSAVFLVFGLLAIVIAAAALLFAGVLADLLAPGIGADQRDEVAHLSQLLAPSSLGLGIVAVASVWSASRERFFASSIGPLLYNLSVILFTIVGAKSLGTSAAALGTVVGALLFALIAVLDAWIGGLRISRPGLADALRPELAKFFKPAFLGRVSLVPYFPLPDHVIKQIVVLQLNRIRNRVRDAYKATFEYAPDLVDQIAARCTETGPAADAAGPASIMEGSA